MKTSRLLLIALVLLLAAALRFHLVGAQSLWNDEGNSYVQATRSFADIAAHAARDIHPPGYYWLLALWRLPTGDSEFALRSLSAFASLLTIAFTYAVGRRLFTPVAGIAAALFVTLNTFSIYYAQEARMYSLLALWSAASLWTLVGFLQGSHHVLVGTQRAASLQHSHTRWALAFALLNAAGLWTQYGYAFVMAAQVVIVALRLVTDVIGKRERRDRARSVPTQRTLLYYIAANLLAIALYLPWLPTAYQQITTWPNTGDSAVPLGAAFSTVLNWLTIGITHTAGSFTAWVYLPLVALAAFIPASAYRRRRLWWRALLPVVWMLLPVALFLAFGLFREGNIKFLLPAQMGFALWMGRSVDAIRGLALANPPPLRDMLRMASLVVPAIFLAEMWNVVLPLYTAPEFRRDDYRAIVRDISAGLRPGDAIILDAPNQEEVFRYYYRGAAPVFALPPGLGGDNAETIQAVRDVIAGHDRVFAVFWGEAERDPNRVVEGTLDTESFEIGDTWYGDVRLSRYVTPTELEIERQPDARFGEHITLQRYALNADSLDPGDALQVRLVWQTDAPLTTRYKVFLQLLDADGTLAAQRDSEPGGGLALTTTWTPGAPIEDRHALIIPPDLFPGEYTLIVGLYDIDNPQARLLVGEDSHLTLAAVTIPQ